LHLHACFVRHLDISMDLFIHPKAPTQNTCAHCQRSFSPETPTFRPSFQPGTFRPGEPPILHHFPFPSTPQFVFLSEPTADSTTEKRLPIPGNFRRRLHFSFTSVKGRESYIRFPFRQPLASLPFRQNPTPLNRRTTHPESLDPDPFFCNFRLSEGARIILATSAVGKGAADRFFIGVAQALCNKGRPGPQRAARTVC